MIIIYRNHQIELKTSAANPGLLCAPDSEIGGFLEEFKLPVISSKNGQVSIKRSDLLLILSSMVYRATNEVQQG